MEQTKNKKKKIGITVGIIASISVAILVQQLFFKVPSFDKVMKKDAIKMNKTCPVMIDQETRLDNVVVLSDNAFQYNYTLINREIDLLDIKAFEDYMIPLILKGVKTNHFLKAYRDNKVTISFNYKDKNGVFIKNISVKAEQYAD